MSREFEVKDVLRVAQELIELSVEFDCSDYNRADFYHCKYCCAEHVNETNFKHNAGCVTFVAQDLLTRSEG